MVGTGPFAFWKEGDRFASEEEARKWIAGLEMEQRPEGERYRVVRIAEVPV